jgi:hypothetical protein
VEKVRVWRTNTVLSDLREMIPHMLRLFALTPKGEDRRYIDIDAPVLSGVLSVVDTVGSVGTTFA